MEVIRLKYAVPESEQGMYFIVIAFNLQELIILVDTTIKRQATPIYAITKRVADFQFFAFATLLPAVFQSLRGLM